MKHLLISLFIVLLAACKQKPMTDVVVTVTNDCAFDRTEFVEIPIDSIAKWVELIDEEQYIVLDADGVQVPQQITWNDNLLFQANVKANSEAVYTIAIGEPIEAETLVYGRHYPERVDDIAWENDCMAYRIFGPASQQKGEHNLGYDVWTKCTPELVVEQRYATELNPDTQAEIARLRKARKYKEAEELYNSVSYHVDHGNGLDCYKVGPTLGCGMVALMQGDNIIYPSCWKEYEILENGPLRFTIRLTHAPFVVDKDSVVETRTISLTKGSQLNKTIVSYTGLSRTMPIATGLVIHPEHPTAYALEEDKGYIAYADLTDNVRNGNGVIYVGAVMPNKIKEAKAVMFSDKEAKERGALGHALAISNYKPGKEYTYYWGAGWSKYGFESMEAWTEYLEHYAQCVRNPLKISY